MISAKTATTNYFKKEFAESEEKYLSEGASQEVSREVSGSLAKHFRLKGKLNKEQFERLANGQDPNTGKQLIEHSTQTEYVRKDGTVVKPDPHKIGTDMVMSPPKSVTAVALVGRDKRALDAHREAVKDTLVEIERFAQANMGNGKREQTGNMLVVSFEHDSDRPVDGFIAPQLHTHNLIINMTKDGDGWIRSMDTDEIFKAQSYFTAFYRARLGMRLEQKGFELERGKNGSFEIKGVSEALLEAYSPRAKQRDEDLAKAGLPYSPKAAELAILHTREKKIQVGEAELRQQWEALNQQHGKSIETTIAASRERVANRLVGDRDEATVRELTREALRHAIDHLSEREAVFDETKILAETLRYEAATIQPLDAKRELLAMLDEGSLIHEAHRRWTSPQAALTTPEMLRMEQENVGRMLAGQDTLTAIGRKRDLDRSVKEFEKRTGLELNDRQRETLTEVTASKDQILGIQGRAGVGKTTVLAIIKEIAERNGYEVQGFAPSNEAAKELAKSGIEANTLQSFTQSPSVPDPDGKRLYVLDESSLSSTWQINRLTSKLGPEDRLLMVGDSDQHVAVEAGAPFELLQKEGMRTSALDEIVRQKHPELRKVVASLSQGEVKAALERLQAIEYRSETGEVRAGIIEIADRQERLSEMVRDFGECPDATLCVAPDNHTRRELNGLIREELQTQGRIAAEGKTVTILVPENTTAAQRKRASAYDVGDVVRFTRDSEKFAKGEYVTVMERDRKANRLTVEKDGGERVTYNPKYLSGVEIFHEEKREIAEGERIQFTTNDKGRGVANRGLGVVARLDESALTIRVDEGKREVQYNVRERQHLDYGYAVTSHSSQGKTIQRVLVHSDTDQGAALVNARTAYVATSRATHEARHYTNNAKEHVEKMARQQMKSSALIQDRAEGARVSLSARTIAELEPVPARKVKARERAQVVTVAPLVEKDQGQTIAAQIPTQIENQVQLKQATIQPPRASLGMWDTARWNLMDVRRMEPEQLRQLDRQHREGRSYADEDGRLVSIKANGTVRIYDPQTDTLKIHPVDLEEATAAIRYASSLLNAERHMEHQITAFVGVATDPAQFQEARLLRYMYGAGIAITLQAPADPSQQRYIPIETTKIYDPQGLIQGTDAAKARAEFNEISVRANELAQGMTGDLLKYGDVRSTARTLALQEMGYQASVYKVVDSQGNERIQMQVFDPNQVGQGKGKSLIASREVSSDEVGSYGYHIQSGQMEDPAYTRQREAARRQEVSIQRQPRREKQQEIEDHSYEYGLSL